MSNLTDRVSYLMGLAEGLNLNDSTAEGKVLVKMLEMLSEMADELDSLRRDHDELDEYVESIDSDLSDLEEAIFEDEEDDDEEGCSCCDCDCEDCDDCDCEGDCENCDCDCDCDEEGDNVVEYACPHCGAEMTFEVDNFDFDEDYLCPACHKPLFPESPMDEE